MRYKELFCILLMLWSCSPVEQTPDEQTPVREQPQPAVVGNHLETVFVKPHKGWIACGGRWTAGEGADLGAGYADQLGPGVLNAGITGEPLPGLLKRLPVLLNNEPQGVILEIGQEDEALNAPPEAFQKHLNTLRKQLGKYPDLKLLVLVSARQAKYRDAIMAFAGRQKALIISGDYFSLPPAAAQHDTLAERVRQMLY